MAGIGVRLERIMSKHTIITHILGSAYSLMVTVAPMFLVILNILLMGSVLGFSAAGYFTRELFSCTILYSFVFSLLTAAPFNSVLSRYMSDVIYEERYDDILPCFYIGLLMNIMLSCLVGALFCARLYLVGGIDIAYVFTAFCCYISLVMVFYSMLYLSICKDYKKISIYFFIGMLSAFLMSLLLVFGFSWEVTFSMLLSLTVGFLLTASLEIGAIKGYFKENSNRYMPVLRYFKKYWKLIVSNFLYTLGLYIHNMVFWTSDLRITVAESFICAPPYDLATCLAMFTNISSSIMFISRVEMRFHGRYKAYSEAVIGGRGVDIENTKKRMFVQLAGELMSLVRIQFIISTVVFLLCVVILPQFGFAGMIMQIYPGLAAGYFILFVMYGGLIFLYYFNDLTGSALTALSFCAATLVVSIYVGRFSPIWYGMGVVIGSFLGWIVAYLRLRWVEKNLDYHIFCQGELVKKGKGKKPPQKVYDAGIP
jgi:uncharacterized membrane protein